MESKPGSWEQLSDFLDRGSLFDFLSDECVLVRGFRIWKSSELCKVTVFLAVVAGLVRRAHGPFPVDAASLDMQPVVEGAPADWGCCDDIPLEVRSPLFSSFPSEHEVFDSQLLQLGPGRHQGVMFILCPVVQGPAPVASLNLWSPLLGHLESEVLLVTSRTVTEER